MGPMMTLLSLYLSTHVPLFLCMSVSQSAYSIRCLSAPGWGGGSTAQMDTYLTWPLDVILFHWSNSTLSVCPHNADQTHKTFALLYQIWPISLIPLNRYINRSVSASLPASILKHIGPSPKQYTLILNPGPYMNDEIVLGWRQMSLHYSHDSTKEHQREGWKKRSSLFFISSFPHLPRPRFLTHKGHKRTQYIW